MSIILTILESVAFAIAAGAVNLGVLVPCWAWLFTVNKTLGLKVMDRGGKVAVAGLIVSAVAGVLFHWDAVIGTAILTAPGFLLFAKIACHPRRLRARKPLPYPHHYPR